MVPSEVERQRLLDYFEARRLYDAQQFESFDRGRLIQLRDDRQTFSAPAYEALYRLWKTEGAAAVDRRITRANGSPARPQAAFETVRLNYNYSLFGGVSRISFRGSAKKSPTTGRNTSVGIGGEAVVAGQRKK